MKIEIFGEPKKEVEKVLRLKLLPGNGGAAVVTAVDERGERLQGGNLIEIRTNGTARRCKWVNPFLPVSLDTYDNVIRLEQ